MSKRYKNKQDNVKQACCNQPGNLRSWDCYCTFGPPSCDACHLHSECKTCKRKYTDIIQANTYYWYSED